MKSDLGYKNLVREPVQKHGMPHWNIPCLSLGPRTRSFVQVLLSFGKGKLGSWKSVQEKWSTNLDGEIKSFGPQNMQLLRKSLI